MAAPLEGSSVTPVPQSALPHIADPKPRQFGHALQFAQQQRAPEPDSDPADVPPASDDDSSANAAVLLGIKLSQNGETVLLKHATNPAAAANVLGKGFDPKAGALNSGYTWFQPAGQDQLGGPSTRAQTVRFEIGVPGLPENTPKLQYGQHHQWYVEAREQLRQQGYAGRELEARANAVRWQRVAEYLRGQSSPSHVIELKRGQYYVCLKEGALSQARLMRISGPDGAKVVRSLSTTGRFGAGVKFGSWSEKIALQVLAGNSQNATSAASQAGLSEAVARRFGASATVMKWVGRPLIAVAVARDAYEIYQAENRPRTVTGVVSGWTGAWAGTRIGAWAGARVGGGIALIAGQAGPQAATPEEIVTVPVAGVIGGLIGGIGGGIGGYIFGRDVSETVYDWAFTK